MRLATDDIVIDSPAIARLRPSLRAAYRLERMYDGFEKLFHLVSDGNLTAIAAVIREGAGNGLDCLDGILSQIGMSRLIEPCLRFILVLSGADDSQANSKGSGKPIPFEQHHTNLFRIATGWLGWTPNDAWNATPAEIIEAYKGRSEMLAALFGGKAKPESEADVRDSDVKRRLNAIGNLTNQRMPV